MKLGTTDQVVKVRRGQVVAAVVLLMLAAPLWAQSSRVFREGNTWVEETTGTLPAGHEFRALTDLGSLQVQGTATQVTYVVRKRSMAESEQTARKQFEQLHVTASKVGDAVAVKRATRPTPGPLNAVWIVGNDPWFVQSGTAVVVCQESWMNLKVARILSLKLWSTRINSSRQFVNCAGLAW